MNSSLDFLKLNRNNAVDRKITIPENCIIGMGEKLFIPEVRLKTT